MTPRTFRILFPALALLRFSAFAETEAPALKVPPVVDRPVEKPTNSSGAKGASIPAKDPAVAPSPSPAGKPQPQTPPDRKEADPAADAPETDDIVSESFPVSRYESLWENSPFQIESIAPPQQSEGLAQRFVLGGILRENGEPVVWVRERATQQSSKVSRNATNNYGLSLVEVQEVMTNQIAATATIRLGNEQGIIKFDSGGAVPAMAVAPAMARPAMPSPPRLPQSGIPAPNPAQVPVPPANAGAVNTQPGVSVPAFAQPGVVPTVPGGAISPNGQIQPGQEQMPPPRVIRRRAIVPAAPSAP